MIRRMCVLVVVVSTAAWALAPARLPAEAQGPRTVTVGLYADAISLDPEDTNDNLSLSVEREIYDGLLGFDSNMKAIPQLATSWEASPDAKVFTFHLRPGVKFQDGSPLDAEAVKLNFDRARDAAHKLKKYNLYEMIQSVDALNPTTVRFMLKQPFGAMLFNFAHPSSRIISPATIKQGEDAIARHPVGSGPFRFVSWTPGQEIVLERNPNFWQSGEPKVDRIVIRFITEDSSRVALLLSGEAQFIFSVPGVQVEAVSRASGVEVPKRWSIYSYGVAMNTQHAPLNILQVRQALNYAVDKDALIRAVLGGHGRPLEAPMAPGVAGYAGAVQRGGWPHDIVKAKQLLSEAGFPNGFRTVLWIGNQTESVRTGEFLQQQLAQVGVTVQVVPTEAGTLTALRYKPLRENQGQLNYTGWSPSTGDADWALRPNFAGESWPPVLFNIAFYKNPKVDALLADALATADQHKRTSDYAQADELIWNDAPWIWMQNAEILSAQRTNIKGIYALGDGTVDLRNAELTGR
ncbi:MAG TPA: glutathione ABC transporter substrate-binding protein [bacterium]|nr:glutathione ABC transporter substrate-binding protein [bacterium]